MTLTHATPSTDQTLTSSILRRDDAGTVKRMATMTEAIGPGPWLCVSPHDDDVAIGMGLTVAAAAAEKIDVHLAVVSDGSKGYGHPEDQTCLAALRSGELSASCQHLGIASEHIHELGLPDGELMGLRGVHRRPDGQFTGIGRLLTGLIRQIQPRVIFVSSANDIHPDHQAVTADIDIACYWATSPMWYDLGEPVALPMRWDYAVYRALPADPHLRVEGSPIGRRAKRDSFAAFASQHLVDKFASGNPVEYLLRSSSERYRPEQYESLFALT